MAKKEGNKVKNGFLFYLFMFVLVIVAAFFILVMIMMFSPGKKILGYTYFNFNQAPIVKTQTTDAVPADFSFSQIKNIEVQSTYANVSVTKSVTKDQKDCIIIENDAKGFAKASQFTGFEYSIKFDKKEGVVDKTSLIVKVKEPQAILFMSKKINIKICVGTGEQTLSDTSFTINTGKGNITIGDDQPQTQQYLDFQTANMSLSTQSGNIKIAVGAGQEPVETTSQIAFGSLYLKTGSGKISSPITNITVNGPTKISVTDDGSCDFSKSVLTSKSQGIELEVASGKFITSKIDGNVKVYKLDGGTIQIEKVDGNFDTNKAQNPLGKGSIVLNEVTKDLSIPYGGKANIKIATLRGVSMIGTTSGNVEISNALCGPTTIETQSGSIVAAIDDSTLESKFDAYFKKIGQYNHVFTSQSGNIGLQIMGEASIRSYNQIKTKGKVDIKLSQNNQFTLSINDYVDQPIEELNSNISIDFITSANEYEAVKKINFPVKTSGQTDDDYQRVVEQYNKLYQIRQIVISTNNKINVHF